MYSQMTHRLRVIISLLLTAAAMLLALSAGLAANATPAAIRTTNGDVAIFNFGFNPPIVTITVGSSVQWTNTADITHTTTSNTGVWDHTLGPGDVFSTTFAAPGVYDYHCAIHPSMQGQVVVLTSVYLPIVTRS